jgi:hypothetical protein
MLHSFIDDASSDCTYEDDSEVVVVAERNLELETIHGLKGSGSR